MKKLLSVLLAVMLVLSMSIVALAEEESDPVADAPVTSTATTFTFAKTYKTTAGATPATTPDETLSFAVAAIDGNPDTTMISIAPQKVDPNGNITVTVPSYSKVGTYNYVVKEKDAGTQGVTYDTNNYRIEVFVYYGSDASKLEVSTTMWNNDEKVNEISNTYDLGGALTVTKTVSGNLASKSQKFDIDVTLTSDKPVLSAISGTTIAVSDWTQDANTKKWTVKKTVSLANSESATFTNIPLGVSYTVSEQAKHAETDANGSDGSKGYTVTYTNATGTVSANAVTATVTNTKGSELKTGIVTDSMPYVILLGCVALFGAAMIIKRKAYND